MLFLLLAILVNVLLAVCFKMFAIKEVDSLVAIIFNYVVCLVLGSLVVGYVPLVHHGFETAWVPFGLMLGGLFIFGFNFAALSIKHTGITVTSVMQRMSLLLSAGFAIVFFSEPFGPLKGGGIGLALIAIVLINWSRRFKIPKLKFNPKIVYPLGILLFSAAIEIILYYIHARGFSENQDLELTTYAFSVAACLGSLYIISEYIRGRRKFRWKDYIGGIALGLPNFFSIYLILVLLKEGFGGSVVFPVLNISILAASAIVGIVFFSERLNRLNVIGLICALLAIFAIMLA